MRQTLSLPAGRSALLLIDMQEEHRLDRRYLVEGHDLVAGGPAGVWRTDMPVPIKFTYENASRAYDAL